jgi:hypothetical protein
LRAAWKYRYWTHAARDGGPELIPAQPLAPPLKLLDGLPVAPGGFLAIAEALVDEAGIGEALPGLVGRLPPVLTGELLERLEVPPRGRVGLDGPVEGERLLVDPLDAGAALADPALGLRLVFQGRAVVAQTAVLVPTLRGIQARDRGESAEAEREFAPAVQTRSARLPFCSAGDREPIPRRW